MGGRSFIGSSTDSVKCPAAYYVKHHFNQYIYNNNNNPRPIPSGQGSGTPFLDPLPMAILYDHEPESLAWYNK